jgi:hypothetical protein
MGLLSEPALDQLVKGCPTCGGQRLEFRAYLDGRLPLMLAEPTGDYAWVYDGEKFVDGVYEVRCTGCQHAMFTADVCPRCDAPGGLARALSRANAYPVPKACPQCRGREVNYIAFVPALVVYESGRATRPTTEVELGDPGLHGFRVDCPDCGTVDELVDCCALCAAPAPLRDRP